LASSASSGAAKAPSSAHWAMRSAARTTASVALEPSSVSTVSPASRAASAIASDQASGARQAGAVSASGSKGRDMKVSVEAESAGSLRINQYVVGLSCGLSQDIVSKTV